MYSDTWQYVALNFYLFQVYIYMNYLKVVMSIFQNLLCHQG